MGRRRVVVVIPSRGRPEQCARLVDRILSTQAAGTAALVSLDIDDPTLPEYGKALAPYITPRMQPILPDPGGLLGPVKPTDPGFLAWINKQAGSHAAAINGGVQHALQAAQPDAIMKMDDDHWPISDGWDLALLQTLDQIGGTGIVYGEDNFQSVNLPTAPLISANIPRTLGYLCPPGFKHLYVDDVWRDWGQRLGRYQYNPTVQIEHRHYQAGKAPHDATYERGNSDTSWIEGHAAYERYRLGQLDRDIEKLRTLL